jgi:hypothetical protein
MGSVPQRAARFRYLRLEIDGSTMRGLYECGETTYCETVTFSHGLDDNAEAVRAVAELWFLIAGLSYYKAHAARTIDVGDLPLGDAGRALLQAAVIDGLGEFAYRNELDLRDVGIVGGRPVQTTTCVLDPSTALVPFGGGIDSVVTVRALPASLASTLFVVSPPSGTFAPLEETASLMNLPIQRATRALDPQITQPSSQVFNGHVPVTAMVTLLAAVSALATRRSGVVMSNEHSASVPNLSYLGRPINHQWSKSLEAERLVSAAIAERCGNDLQVASFLRDRSELWVAQQFVQHRDVLATFRSCNRAFRQQRDERATSWCGECDKCLFINLVLAPFLPSSDLDDIFRATAPIRRPAMAPALRTLVGLGAEKKPFECVGDPDECAVALHGVVQHPEYVDCDHLRAIDAELSHDRSLKELLQRQGVSRVPASWLS